MKRLAIVRTSGAIINPESYNCQELGLAKALACRGWYVSVIMAADRNAQTDIQTEGPGSVTLYSVRFKAVNQSLAWFDGIEKLLDRINPDVIQIHEFGMLMSWRVVRYARKRHIPVVLIQGTYQTTLKPVFKQLEQMFNSTMGKYILRHVQAVGCKTDTAAEYINRYHHCRCNETPVGLDESKFNSSAEANTRTHGKKLLYVGVLEQRRNPLFLIEVMTKLPDDYTLTLVGDGPLANEVYDKIQQMGLQNRVTLLGKMKQNDLLPLYKSHDLFLLASDYEIFGMVILEAMYFGLPVISTSTAGSKEILKNDFGSYIIEKDANQWADAIMQYCAQPEDQKTAISKQCMQLIRDKYVWDSASVNFENLYLEALK